MCSQSYNLPGNLPALEWFRFKIVKVICWKITRKSLISLVEFAYLRSVFNYLLLLSQSENKRVPLSMAIGNGELMHECFTHAWEQQE